jgi:hypothetical protein
MFDATEPASDAAHSRLRRAEHAGGAYDADIAACRTIAVANGALHYVAHITSGVFDFALDSAGKQPPSHDMSDAFDRAGRQLSLAVVQLDETCKPLDSGTLIRVVIQGDSGALFQFLLRASRTFFGLTLNGSRQCIDQADHQMTKLSESAVRRLEKESLNWGGFKEREASGELWKIYKPVLSAHGPISPYVARSGYPVPDAVSQACRGALDSGHLHFVGIYRGGRPAWCADIFDDPALAPLFQRVTPEARRRGYARLVSQVQLQSRRFEQLLKVVRSDHFTRIVLEVARGAAFVLPLNEDDYLVGATLDHTGVKPADQQVQALSEKIRKSWRGHLWRAD